VGNPGVATRWWVPPQQGPHESVRDYVKALQAKIDALEKMVPLANRDRAKVLQHRIEQCEKEKTRALMTGRA